MSINPGDGNYPHDMVWCRWDKTHRILTKKGTWMVLRYANAIEGSLGNPGLRYVPVVFDVCDAVALVEDVRHPDGWFYVSELFVDLPEDLQKQVLFNS